MCASCEGGFAFGRSGLPAGLTAFNGLRAASMLIALGVAALAILRTQPSTCAGAAPGGVGVVGELLESGPEVRRRTNLSPPRLDGAGRAARRSARGRVHPASSTRSLARPRLRPRLAGASSPFGLGLNDANRHRTRSSRGHRVRPAPLCAGRGGDAVGVARRAGRARARAAVTSRDRSTCTAKGPGPCTSIRRCLGHFRHRASFHRRQRAPGHQRWTAPTTSRCSLSDVPPLFRRRPHAARRRARQPSARRTRTGSARSASPSTARSRRRSQSLRRSSRRSTARMPRTLGDSLRPCRRTDHFGVEVDFPPRTHHPPRPSADVERRIGEHVGRARPRRARALQMGIGAHSRPRSPGRAREQRDLGVHTEMFSDGLLDLVEAGVSPAPPRTIHRGKSCALRGRHAGASIDFVDDNPLVELHPARLHERPGVIRRRTPKMRRDQLGDRGRPDRPGLRRLDRAPALLSGVGGQMDFMRGAALSRRRQADHRAAVDRQRGAVSRIVVVAGRRAPGW